MTTLEGFTITQCLYATNVYSLYLGVKEGKTYCLKIYRKKDLVEQGLSSKVKKEKDLMKEVGQLPFVSKLHLVFQDRSRLLLVYDYFHGGNLKQRLKEWQFCPNDVALFYATEVLVALQSLHANDIVYRALCPDNLLIGQDGHICLWDFSKGKKLNYDRTYTIGNFHGYSAPEQLISNGHTKLVDWWAFGILIFNLLTGEEPFQAGSPIEVYDNILKPSISLPDWLPEHSGNLLRKLICADPRKRLGFGPKGAKEIMKQKWFEGVDFEDVARRMIPPPWIPNPSTQYYQDFGIQFISDEGEAYVDLLI